MDGMERWRNKVAVVTGASSGIGAACCRALAECDVTVVGLARRVEQMDTVTRQSIAPEKRRYFHALKCDVSREESILEAFAWIEQRFGAVHILINNAGILRPTKVLAANNTADLRATIDTNLLAVALCTREAFRLMQQGGIDGHVVIINSVAGHVVPHLPNTTVNIYPSTKHALTALTEVLRQEFLQNQTKIKITSISPGLVATEIFGTASDLVKGMPKLEAKDVADAVLYCLQTPPHVQIHELTIKPIGEMF